MFARILLLVIILIVYGSLYPFDFHSRQLADGPLWTLLHSWPSGVDRYILKDIVLNVLIYLPAGFFATLALSGGKPSALSVALAVLLAMTVSACMETIQLYDDSRTASMLDLLSNTLGSAIGAGLAVFYGKRLARMLANPRLTDAFRPSGALLLICCWIGYLTFPLIPQLSRTQLSLKLASLSHPSSFSIVQLIGALADWLIVARLLEAFGGAGVLPWMMLLLPARLFITGRSFTWPEILGAAGAVLLWNRAIHSYKKNTILLAWTAVAVLLLRGLAPYHWQSTAASFSWAPFAASLNADQGSSGMIFLGKSFLYGAVLWLFRRSGYSDLITISGVVLLLAIIEALQTHLPGRTPEITDPLYAVILAFVLRLLDSADRQASGSATAALPAAPYSEP